MYLKSTQRMNTSRIQEVKLKSGRGLGQQTREIFHAISNNTTDARTCRQKAV